MKAHRCLTTFIFFIFFFIPYQNIYGDQVWDGASSPPANVLNENLFIDGSSGAIYLSNGLTTVQALTSSVNITVNANPVVTAVNGAQSVLLLNARNGNSINFTLNGVNQNLSFQGPNATLTPLLIVATTDGSAGARINIQCADNTTFALLSNTDNNAGVHMYQWMGSTAFEAPTTTFSRLSPGLNPVRLLIDTHCLISYLSSQGHNLNSTPSDTGRFLFDPSNTSSGRFLVEINDGAAVVIEGHATNNITNPALITFANIQRNIPAGLQAVWEIAPSTSGSLLVTNKNSSLFGLLTDPFGDAQQLGNYTGIRLGCVLGGTGILTVNSNSYFDYVGLNQLTMCPTQTLVPAFAQGDAHSLLKGRNPSAFFVDGINQNYGVMRKATINLNGTAGFYMRSGVDSNGTIQDNLLNSDVFTIDPQYQTEGQGVIVFDVEGPLQVNGSGITSSKFELLSLQVFPTGGPLQSGGTETIFPLRTFAQDGNDKLLQYNKACMFINNDIELYDVSLDHTDTLHTIVPQNDGRSEPTYIGGESWNIKAIARPSLSFINSALQIHTDIAFTGLDLKIPNKYDTLLQTHTNNSQFNYYYSGRLVEDATGRMMVMGTQIGSTACNNCSVVSRDAHLDIMQTTTAAIAGIVDTLSLGTGLNTATINNDISTPLMNQYGIHTIFLGHNSNITIGNQLPVGNNGTVQSKLSIDGNYFSIVSNGGKQGVSSLSGITGVGGIFVDNGGMFTIAPQVRASIGTMVTKSGTGIINLSKSQINFEDTVGITDWKLDLTTTTTIIDSGISLSDYTLNWIDAVKDYAGGFVPYQLLSVNNALLPVATSANIYHIPTIVGSVDQLQIQGSRIGDQVHCKINGGRVRELIFQKAGGYSAQAATGLIVIENNGRVGLGTALRNVDSFEGSFVLGANGVTLLVNGDGQVDLNEDIIINNVCSMLKGPDAVQSVFRINADVATEFRIKSDAVFDLSQFVQGDTVEFTGNVKIILEPGAKIITGGATLAFADDSILLVEPNFKSQDTFNSIPHDFNHNSLLDGLSTATASLPHNQLSPLTGAGTTANTDSFRAKLIGTGTYLFSNNASFLVPQYAYVGVESLKEVTGNQTREFPTTNLTIELQDNAAFVIGEAVDHYTVGGSFQVGNTTNLSEFDHTVTTNIVLNSPNALFSIHPSGFVGFSVGIIDKRAANANNWLVDSLYNVEGITLTLNDGVMDHSRTFSGDNKASSLLAFGPATYAWVLESDPTVATNRTNQVAIHGGGNISLINPIIPDLAAYHPVVNSDSPEVIANPQNEVSPIIKAGILASRPMISLPSASTYSATTMFNISRIHEITQPGVGQSLATAAYTNDKDPSLRRSITAGFVNNGKIGRTVLYDIADANGGLQEERLVKAASLGAVSVQLNDYTAAPGTVVFAQQLP